MKIKANPLFEKIKIFFELSRIRNCAIGFFAIFVVAFFLNYNFLEKSMKLLLAGLSLFFIMAAGNMINDYFDFQVDNVNKKFKPIPSGKIKRDYVLALSAIFFILGILLAFYINSNCATLATFNSLILVFYAKFSKKIIFISNFIIAYLTASIFIFALFSTETELKVENFRLLSILTASAFLMTLSREIIKDIEDEKADKVIGGISIPIKFGNKIARNIAIIFALSAVLVSFLPFFILKENFNLFYYGTLIFLANAIFLISFRMKPEKTQRIMILGMFLALIAFFVGKF
ncbi:MAG: UbiA family prenyltransferase [Candidatus Altiarchaeota archaeon]